MGVGAVMSTEAERVEAGAAYWDEKIPGWEDRVNEQRLDTESRCHCVARQLLGAWEGLVPKKMSFGRSQSLGMAALSESPAGREWEYEALNREWRSQIAKRRNE